MKRETHGVISLGLAAMAIAAASQSMFQQSIVLGVMYMFLAGLSVPVILYAFCAKCPDRERCGHVIPGKSAKVFKGRKEEPYTASDLSLTAAALAVLFFFPRSGSGATPSHFAHSGSLWPSPPLISVEMYAGDAATSIARGTQKGKSSAKSNKSLFIIL